MAIRHILFVTAVPIILSATAGAQRSTSNIDTLLRSAVDQKRVPMVVAMVADGGGGVYEHASGASKDAIFAIAAMSKPVTSVAVMQLVEAGRVKLEEPAATYVPELTAVQVLEAGYARRRHRSRCVTCSRTRPGSGTSS